MSPETLTSYLHRTIPLTAAMKLSASVASAERVVLHCPIAPNVNHHQTAFGGSISAALMLAGWSIMRVRMGAAGLLAGASLELATPGQGVRQPTDVRLVVSKSATDFLHPVTEDFTVECRLTDEAAWSRFVTRFQSNHWAKLRLQPTILGPDDRRPLAKMKATFVAVQGNGPADVLAQ